jgi:hypothetical protein
MPPARLTTYRDLNMTAPYTIRIFVPDGDPDGVRVIDKMNWTGKGIVFPRQQWTAVRGREEFELPGVYLLVGNIEEDDLPTIYVGEGDGVRSRIESHAKQKDFWSWGIAFVASGRGLNKAHVQWLEYKLVELANNAKRSHLDNGNVPQEPALAESDKADCRSFLSEILQVLPLVGLRALESPKAIEAVKSTAVLSTNVGSEPDTIIVPAREEGFQKVFLGEDRWHAIRVSGGMLPKLKWIAAYQIAPISAVTHLAPIHHIEPFGEGGKYLVVFSEPATAVGPIQLGDAPSGAMQGPRYTTRAKLLASKTVAEAVAKPY